MFLGCLKSSEGYLVSARGPAVPGTEKIEQAAGRVWQAVFCVRAVGQCMLAAERASCCVVSQSGRGGEPACLVSRAGGCRRWGAVSMRRRQTRLSAVVVFAWRMCCAASKCAAARASGTSLSPARSLAQAKEPGQGAAARAAPKSRITGQIEIHRLRAILRHDAGDELRTCLATQVRNGKMS